MSNTAVPSPADRDVITNASSLDCTITAYATSRLTTDEANALRKKSDTLPGNLGNSLLRHCDEQTLVALVAVRDAIERFETPQASFQDWGVVCSSRYLGRSAFAQALNKFAVDGPWNVSVQVVPNRSLHSPASMVGLALGCHGPCVGVGGGLDGEPEAWLTAASLLDQHKLPGIWLVFSGWEPDHPIDVEGVPLSETQCTALVVGLQAKTAAGSLARMRIMCDPFAPAGLEIPAKSTAIASIERFIASQAIQSEMKAMLGGGLCAQFEWSADAATTIPLSTPFTGNQKKAA